MLEFSGSARSSCPIVGCMCGTEHDIVPGPGGPQEIISHSLSSPIVFYSTIQLHCGCDSRFNIHHHHFRILLDHRCPIPLVSNPFSNISPKVSQLLAACPPPALETPFNPLATKRTHLSKSAFNIPQLFHIQQIAFLIIIYGRKNAEINIDTLFFFIGT